MCVVTTALQPSTASFVIQALHGKDDLLRVPLSYELVVSYDIDNCVVRSERPYTFMTTTMIRINTAMTVNINTSPTFSSALF